MMIGGVKCKGGGWRVARRQKGWKEIETDRNRSKPESVIGETGSGSTGQHMETDRTSLAGASSRQLAHSIISRDSLV
ncbi:BQ5605_C007g04464 [Microbotryum silenes-dioicae]|uniref:BQ5605_C007g04464 protein n=1 Tax=Microbotryum silenes-dioicae TaxID=796604 RepID=A0A2X0MB86_9BASI|nr:BQ5605_C007g04464 [Microbotryum silenes-dioicae]